MFAMKLHKKIQVLCGRKGWDRAQLAREVGVTQSTVSPWWHGEGRPSLDAALQIARALDVSLERLADDSADVPPEPSRDERMLADLVDRLGVAEVLRRVLDYEPPLKPTGGKAPFVPVAEIPEDHLGLSSTVQPNRENERTKRPRFPRS